MVQFFHNTLIFFVNNTFGYNISDNGNLDLIILQCYIFIQIKS